MAELKYTIIKNKTQYKDYCSKLEYLVFSGTKSKAVKDEIDLLTLLIEKWDAEHNSFHEVDPVTLLRSFMEEQQLKATDLVELLRVSKGYVSEILNYKKGMSKEVIRKLAERFKVSHEAFNRAYDLKTANDTSAKNRAVKRRKRKLAIA
jgi:HTH-type transcriptional regulator / antitoxin HigA